MPMPMPDAGESQDGFMTRCMTDDTMMADFADHAQRAAVCMRQLHGPEQKSARRDDIRTKAISGFEIKDMDRGEVTAVVSTFNVVDLDGDVILPGAIRDGTPVKVSAYGHDIITEGKPPVGRGALAVDHTRAEFNGKYFLSTQRAREAFSQVKEMGPESEWSVGYPERSVKTIPMTAEWRAKGAKRLIAEITISEVSPVFMGANQYTRTVAVKSAAESEADATDMAARAAALDAAMRRFSSEMDTMRAKLAADEAEAIRVKSETEATVRAAGVAAAKAEADAATEAKVKADIIAAVSEKLAAAKAQAEVDAAAKVAADQKAAEDAIAAKAAAETAVLRTKASEEFERFQRTMRRHWVA